MAGNDAQRMAAVDKIKEEIGWLKLLFGLFFVTMVSLISWIAQNHPENGNLLWMILLDLRTLLAYGFLVGLYVILVYCAQKIHSKIQEIGEISEHWTE